MTTTTIKYAWADELAILIRRAGGGAYVERENGSDVVKTNRSRTWVARLLRRHKWMSL